MHMKILKDKDVLGIQHLEILDPANMVGLLRTKEMIILQARETYVAFPIDFLQACVELANKKLTK